MIQGVLLWALLPTLSVVRAQTTQVECGSSFSFLSNSLGQNPCVIAGYLEDACVTTGGLWNIPALPYGESYVGPGTAQATYCTCSSVSYSLVSACGACQSELWIPWSSWRENCSASIVTVGQWPLNIPQGTAVPAWAFQDVAINNTFNIDLARTDTAPASTYVGSQTATVASGSTSGSSSSPTASSSSHKSNAGAIAGGVIGGIAALVLLGILIFLLYRRYKERHNNVEGISPVAPYYADDPSNIAQVGYPETVNHSYNSSPTMFSEPPSMQQKLYDPADPSTFPQTPASFGYTSTNGQTGISHASPGYTGHSLTSSGQYTGAAEV